MSDDLLPALYESADKIAKDSQSVFCWLFGMNLVFLTIAVALSVFYVASVEFIYCQILVLFASLGITVLLGYQLPEKTWYGGRALAESTKTIAWRFMMNAEPFNVDDTKSSELFLEKLKKLIIDNKEITSKSVASLGKKEITDEMKSVRASNMTERKKYYLNNRIIDQFNWYKSKSAFNQKRSKQCFFLISLATSFAIAFSILRISNPTAEQWPTDIFIGIASALLGWNQAKKFRELSASYAQTAYEISLIKAQASQIRTEKEFSTFVGDAENAFSREHVQWLARRDI
jgi:hypothetical protein